MKDKIFDSLNEKFDAVFEDINKSFLEYCKDRNIHFIKEEDGIICDTWRDYIKALDLLGDMGIPFKTFDGGSKKIILDKQYLQEKIVKVGNQWQVQSEKGRNMGTYDTKEEAEKRLHQIEYFKYKNEDLNNNETIWYHGTLEENIKEFNKPVNWFTADYNYANGFGKIIYKCKLNCKNIFNAGQTDGRIYNLLPIQPYKFSNEFMPIANLFNEIELRQILDSLALENDYKNDGYKMPIFTFIRSQYFANKMKELGYNAISTIEFGHKCIGILNPADIIIIEKSITETLNEDTRATLINKSRNAGDYKDKTHGKNRFERKKYSKVASSVQAYNQLDMNDLFKKDILTIKIPVTGETDSYTVSIKLEGVVAEIQKEIKNNKNQLEFKTIIQSLTKIFNTGNVYVNCNCPDYLYNFDHWNIINNVATNDTAHDPGPGKNIRNPKDDKGRGCKHVLLVLANGDWMMKVASVIMNYTNYAAEHMKTAFNKLIFPKLYNTTVDEATTIGLVPEDTNLETEPNIIDIINKWSKERGKYKPGSNKNPVTGTGGRQKKEQEAEK